MKPVEIEFLIKNGTRGTLEKITADLLQVGSDGKASATSAAVALEKTQLQAVLLKDVIASLEEKIRSLKTANPDLSQSENIEEINKLESRVESLKANLKDLENVSDTTNMVPPAMPTAKRQFDGLHFSIQQIAREMPTLAMGPQMFFMAISNNLPILSDEIARAKREYNDLIKTGQKGVPVWKQVIKSLFSWQTAMTTGIMLLVMYGDEIIKSVQNMLGWKTAKQQMREELEKTIEVEKEANKVAATHRFELTQVMNAIKNFNGSKDEERQKVDELAIF